MFRLKSGLLILFRTLSFIVHAETFTEHELYLLLLRTSQPSLKLGTSLVKQVMSQGRR